MKRRTVQGRLIWIFGASFIALLTDIMSPALRRSDRGYAIWTQAGLKDIVLGINNYRMEYGSFPLLKEQTNKGDQRFESTGPILSILLGKNVQGLNPREIAYIEPPMGRAGKRGLIEDGPTGEYKLMDSWGHPYVVVLDANYDNQIENPDCKNSSSKVIREAPATLTIGAIAYSVGPDGVEGTADDITSWRPAPGLSATQQTLSFAVPTMMLVSFLVISAQGIWLIADVIRWLLRKPTPTDDYSTKPQ